MGDFSRISNFDPKANYRFVRIGADCPVLEIELNEMQQITERRLQDIVKTYVGEGVKGVGSYAYSGGILTISNEKAIIDGTALEITQLRLPIAEGERAYIQMWLEEVTFEDTLKYMGNVQETRTVENKILDTNIGIETSRRMQIQYDLVKDTNLRTDKNPVNFYLGLVSNGKFILDNSLLKGYTNTKHVDKFIVDHETTDFHTKGFFRLNCNALQVFVDGVLQLCGVNEDYQEISNNLFRFNTPVKIGSEVVAIYTQAIVSEERPNTHANSHSENGDDPLDISDLADRMGIKEVMNKLVMYFEQMGGVKAFNNLLTTNVNIKSFTSNTPTPLVGDTVTSLTLQWELDKEPTTQKINGELIDNTLRRLTLNEPITDNKDFTLEVTDVKGNVTTSSFTFVFVDKVYCGTTTQTHYNGDTINSLQNAILSEGYFDEIVLTATKDEYMVFFVPSTFSTPRFYVDGVEDGFDQVGTVQYTDERGFTSNYDVYRSENKGLGIIDIQITYGDDLVNIIGDLNNQIKEIHRITDAEDIAVDGTNLKLKLEDMSNQLAQLSRDVAELLYKVISITSFNNNRNVVEKGSRITSTHLSWSLNKRPNTLTLDGQSIDVSSTSKDVDKLITDNTTFTLEATDERGARTSKQTSIIFQNGVYYGVSNTDIKDSQGILSLSKVLSDSRNRNINVNCGNGQYIYYCLPSRLGACKFVVGGFEGGFSKTATISFTNSQGFTENYDIYKSTNTNLGNTTITIS